MHQTDRNDTPPLPWDRFENSNAVNTSKENSVTIVGAGLAGCWLARSLAELGIHVAVVEMGPSPASGASSNPAGIVKPYVTRHPGYPMRFYIEAHQYLLKRLQAWNLIDACGFSGCGVVQLVEKPYPESEYFTNLNKEKMTQTIGLPSIDTGIHFEQSGWLNPSALCHALLNHPLVEITCNAKVTSIKQSADHSWHLSFEDLPAVATFNLILCSGLALTNNAMTMALPIVPARGQISRFAVEPSASIPRCVVNGKHYLIPDGNSVLVGATFERGNDCRDLKAKDDDENLAGIQMSLPSLQIKSSAIASYAGVRATTPDRMPLVGPIPDTAACDRVYGDLQHGRTLSTYPSLPTLRGACMLGGLGSRGIVTAPFSAHLLSDYLTGGNLIDKWASLVNPVRFQIRQLKRG